MKDLASTSPPPSLPRRRALWALLLGPALLVLAQGPDARASPGREHQLKAAILYNFTKFVDWPPRAFAASDAPLVIGTYGDGPVAAELERMVAGRRLNARRYVVRKVSASADARSVHVLFFDQASPADAAELIDAVGDSPVLLVGDSDDFLDRGGAIQLLVVNDKIAFDIDVARAHRSGLQVSAQLQKLARNVRRDR